MSQASTTSVRDRFNRVASALTVRLGSPIALLGAVSIIVIWAVSGPFFGFSETWQLLINTGTTIVTFLMVFVIQASQNRDSKALHLKLDEVIRAVEGARNELIAAESSSEEELAQKEEEFLQIAEEGAAAAVGDVHAPGTEEHVKRRASKDEKVRAVVRSAAERTTRSTARRSTRSKRSGGGR